MYSRKISQAPSNPIKNGKPIYGTFFGKFENFDIRGQKQKIGPIPLPLAVSKIRIFDVLRFYFLDENYVGEIELFNANYFSFMQATIWCRKTNKKSSYRKVKFLKKLKFPRKHGNSKLVFKSKSRYVKIQIKKGKKIFLNFDFLGSNYNTPFSGQIENNSKSKDFAEVSSFVPNRVYSKGQLGYFCLSPIQGSIQSGLTDYNLKGKEALSFLEVKKYHSFLRSYKNFLTGLGKVNDKFISFRLAKTTNKDDDLYNENIVFWEGKVWPLPPVKITFPYGVKNIWVVQDTESMVDLNFTPKSLNSKTISLFVARTSYHCVLGDFSGTLRLNEVLKIDLKNFPGIGKKIILRA